MTWFLVGVLVTQLIAFLVNRHTLRQVRELSTLVDQRRALLNLRSMQLDAYARQLGVDPETGEEIPDELH